MSNTNIINIFNKQKITPSKQGKHNISPTVINNFCDIFVALVREYRLHEVCAESPHRSFPSCPYMVRLTV